VRRRYLAPYVLATSLGAPALAIGAASYNVVDVGTIGGTTTIATAINESGWVTGYATTGDGASHAFLWDGSEMRNLGTFGGTVSYGSAINSSGWVTGFATITGNTQYAFLWTGGKLRNLGALGGSFSYGKALNDSGWVVGYAATAGEAAYHAFLWNGGKLQDLGTLGGTSSFAEAINARGRVIGFSEITGNVGSHAFLWNGSKLIDLNTFLPPGSPWILGNADAINDAGQIVATGYNTVTGETHSFVLAPLAQVSVTPSDGVSFGTVPRFSLLFRQVTVKNTGMSAVSISSVSVTSGVGTDRHEFLAVSLCPSSLAVGKSCRFIIVFFANHLGSQAATLRITDSAVGSPQMVPITATVTNTRH
jgi:probable HAF family extracellular repeat protein